MGLPVLVCLCHYFQQSSALQRRDHLTQNNGLQSTGKSYTGQPARLGSHLLVVIGEATESEAITVAR